MKISMIEVPIELLRVVVPGVWPMRASRLPPNLAAKNLLAPLLTANLLSLPINNQSYSSKIVEEIHQDSEQLIKIQEKQAPSRLADSLRHLNLVLLRTEQDQATVLVAALYLLAVKLILNLPMVDCSILKAPKLIHLRQHQPNLLLLVHSVAIKIKIGMQGILTLAKRTSVIVRGNPRATSLRNTAKASKRNRSAIRSSSSALARIPRLVAKDLVALVVMASKSLPNRTAPTTLTICQTTWASTTNTKMMTSFECDLSYVG